MDNVIAVCSGKGGTGKTTSAAALSVCLARHGNRVCVIDCDVGLRNLDLVLGLEDAALFDFADIIAGRVTAQDAVCAHPMVPGLDFLTAPQTRESFTDQGFSGLIRELSGQYDYVVLDAPAGLGAGFRMAVENAGQTVIVANPDTTSLRDAQQAVVFAREIDSGSKIWLLVNRLRRSLLRVAKKNVDDIIDTVGAQLIGIVREDPDVSSAGETGVPLTMYREARVRSACAQFDRIAARLTGESIPLGLI